MSGIIKNPAGLLKGFIFHIWGIGEPFVDREKSF
jgi:hypothetical protein